MKGSALSKEERRACEAKLEKAKEARLVEAEQKKLGKALDGMSMEGDQ